MPESIRLILVDNGSDPPTQKFLEGFQSSHSSGVLLIRNAKNEGFIKGVNRGIQAGDAPWVCVMNNDTVTASGWLTEMLKIAQSDPSIGLVNPTSNSLGFHHGKIPIESYAAGLRPYSGQWTGLSTALGFCLLGRRSLFEKVGLFDEAFGMGYFEDDDLSNRVKAAGFLCVRACGAYVYHEERASFSLIPQKNEAFLYNRRLFEKRWGRRLRILWTFKAGPSSSHLFPTEAIRRLASEGHWLTVAVSSGDLPEEIRSYSQVSSLKTHGLPWRWAAALRLLIKRKKPFDVVVSDDAMWLRCLHFMGWFHRARLFQMVSGEEIVEKCRALSHA